MKKIYSGTLARTDNSVWEYTNVNPNNPVGIFILPSITLRLSTEGDSDTRVGSESVFIEKDHFRTSWSHECFVNFKTFDWL